MNLVTVSNYGGMRENALSTTTNSVTLLCIYEVYINTNCCLTISQVRIEADRKYLKSAKRMAEKYNKRKPTQTFAIGDKVSVWIPRIDQANSDLPHLPCVVFTVVGGARTFYRLRQMRYILSVN